jgi:hypothetical protein
MHIPMLAGRDFTPLDRTGGERVAIVSAALASRYWPGQNAVGKRLKLVRPDAVAPWLRVIAVVADVRYREWETSRFDVYIPLEQRAQHRSDFVVRTSNDPLALSGEIQRAIASIDKDQPVSSLTTVDSLVAETFALPRFNLTLLVVFAGCALALAMAGVFALLMHAVTQRIHEIGIRMALGAPPRRCTAPRDPGRSRLDRARNRLRRAWRDGGGSGDFRTPCRYAPTRCRHYTGRRICRHADIDRRQPPARPPRLSGRPHPRLAPRVGPSDAYFTELSGVW